MTAVVRGEMPPDTIKGPVVDTQFDVDGVTYVKAAPPMGSKSEFFSRGRPRKDSTGLTRCPLVATTFPDMTADEWRQFREALPNEDSLFDEYEEWRAERTTAAATGKVLIPFVPIAVT